MNVYLWWTVLDTMTGLEPATPARCTNFWATHNCSLVVINTKVKHECPYILHNINDPTPQHECPYSPTWMPLLPNKHYTHSHMTPSLYGPVTTCCRAELPGAYSFFLLDSGAGAEILNLWPAPAPTAVIKSKKKGTFKNFFLFSFLCIIYHFTLPKT